MDVVILGAGQAAQSCAAKLRQLDGAANIYIFGDEPVPPYQRPPLSKAYLAGDMELDRLLLRPVSWYDEQEIVLNTGLAATEIDRAQQTVTFANARKIRYDKLVFATGSRPRMLPPEVTGGNHGVYTVRELIGVDGMRHEFQEGRKLLVIGGGYIGLEAAAVARKFGVEVTLVEAAPRILGRVACAETADYMRALHQSHGVEIIEGVGLERLIRDGHKLTGARLADGREIAADFAMVGIGILPNSELACAAGIACEHGIMVDAHCQTNDANIYAAGDVARFFFRGDWIRIESVGNAIDQGEAVARNIVNGPSPYEPKPWFWSDQYDLTLQIAGLNTGYDDIVIRDGVKAGSRSIWYYQGDKLLAVDAMSEPRAYMFAKRMIDAGKSVPKSVAADSQANLKDWL